MEKKASQQRQTSPPSMRDSLQDIGGSNRVSSYISHDQDNYIQLDIQLASDVFLTVFYVSLCLMINPNWETFACV